MTRDEILKTGEDLAARLIPWTVSGGRARIGSVAMMALPLPGRAILVGAYGYLGLLEKHEDGGRTLHTFGMGSAVCENAIRREFLDGRTNHVEIPNTRRFGRGSDEAVIRFLVEAGIPAAVSDMLAGVSRPEAGLVAWGMGDGAWDAQKWGLHAEPTHGRILIPYAYA